MFSESLKFLITNPPPDESDDLNYERVVVFVVRV